ncbi:MAG TPA: radical SAM family heme chaperone HemW [Acidiferrobacterales bacterium]|nr:radical SAM family heme chaperone HemW [Acidiferrobacterales bacterium]
MFQFTALPPLSLYIHFPWCVRKCPYCDFNSHAVRGDLPEDQYIDALLADLESDLPRVWGRPVRSVFLGGGTPSLFSPEAIERLLAGVRARVALVPEAEVTLEANPGTVETERFRGYRAAGVNRLSIGIQSFQPEQLKKLGRIHGRDEALAAAQAAHAAGFDNFNLDLMFGLPQQTLDEALTDLRTALALNPTHLSLYQLTLEPNTLFHAQPPELPDEDVLAAMQETLQAELADAGFAQYEVSAYAHAGRRCRHNLNYWQFGDYLGIGAGAHAKITDAGGITRLWKVKQPRNFLETAGTTDSLGGEQRLGAVDVAFEFMLNALRLTEGIPALLFSERTGLDPSCMQKPLTQAMARGLLEPGLAHIRPTPLGRRFLNELVALFLPEAKR